MFDDEMDDDFTGAEEEPVDPVSDDEDEEDSDDEDDWG